MNQQEILEYNKRCAEFLGAIYSNHAKAWGFGNAKNIGTMKFKGTEFKDVIQAERFEKVLQFHSDWNWIMEVVDAIEKLGGEYYLGNKSFAISYTLSEGNWYAEDTIVKTDRPTKEAVVQAINQFLIWYNKNIW